MRLRIRLLLATLVAAAGASLLATRGASATQEVQAFVDVTVIPMTGERVLPMQTVIVRNGRIHRMGPSRSTRPPRGATLIDGRQRFLMPGLSEMHAHIPPAQAGDTTIERTLFLYLANGITTARGMLGQPAHLQWRDRANRGEILSPRIWTSGPSINGNSVQTPDSARRAVLHQHRAGYDFLKLHPGISRAVFDAMARTADSVGIPYAGHVSLAVGLQRTLEARQATIDHLDGYVEALVRDGAPVTASESQFFGFNLTGHLDESRIPALARATREAGVWNVPTQSLFIDFLSAEDPQQLAQRPELRYMPAQTVQQWVTSVANMRNNPSFSRANADRFMEVRRQILRELHRAGAPLLLGSDAPQVFNVPGFAIHQEMQSLVDAGIPPYAVLESGTRNVARFFGIEAEAGTVETGKRADLILLSANPLEDIRNVRRLAGVMIGGRWLPRAEIDRRLEEIARAYAR
jgi:imidazolonepropionase-like amidohydrolase